VRVSTPIYMAAAHAAARVLAAPGVRSTFVRRSVAAGDALFPLSDLDIGLVVDGFDGAAMAGLLHRMRAARGLIPRLGEAQVTTADELRDLAECDPYRASIDRRTIVTVRGDAPVIPCQPLPPMAVARRLVFWLDHYMPWAVRRRRRRDQRKFTLEMWNALGVLQGRWPEPHVSRRTVLLDWEASGCGDGAPPFVQCCRIAGQAHAWLGRSAPRIERPVLVPGPRPIMLLPACDSPWPAGAWRDEARVLTPPALDLLMAAQDPFLWLDARGPLQALGFSAPERGAWLAACARHTSTERLRRPGFIERGPVLQARRLARVEAVLAWVEGGQTGAPAEPPPDRAAPASVPAYYRAHFDQLLSEAARLRRRVRALAAQQTPADC